MVTFLITLCIVLGIVFFCYKRFVDTSTKKNMKTLGFILLGLFASMFVILLLLGLSQK